MNTKDKKVVDEAAEHLLRGLAPTTHTQYRRLLKKWYRFMRTTDRKLKDYDVEGARDWFRWLSGKTKSNVAENRMAIFPLRCVELAQTFSTAVSPNFAIPYALWQSRGIHYRDHVISEARLVQLRDLCIKEVAAAKELTTDTLLSFVVLLAIRTAMNAESLMSLRRDCLQEEETGARLLWFKARSDGAMSDFYRYGRWSVVEIVKRLQALGQDKEFLMVATDTKTRPVRLNPTMLTRWCRKRGVKRFTIAELRPAVATMVFRNSGGNITEVKNLLHHKSPATTVLYLEENAIRPVVEKKLGVAMDAIFKKIQRGGTP